MDAPERVEALGPYESPEYFAGETESAPTTVDEELAAMARIVDALGSLDGAARERVMHWASDRFFPVVLSTEARRER